MRKAAAEAGYDLDRFDQVVLSYPMMPKFGAGAYGSPGTIWMPGKEPWAAGFTHEFGHALGIGHASAFEGGKTAYPGEHREGRDGLFMMGSDNDVNLEFSGRRAPVNLPMRYKMGFLDERLVQRLAADQLEVPTTYRISAFDREALSKDVEHGRSLAVVFESGGKEFWVSFAPTLAEYWSEFNGEGWARGVMVHELDDAVTRIIDFTPGSQGGSGNEADYVDTRDGSLQVRKEFAFPDSNIGIGVLRTGGSKDGVRWIDVKIGQTRPQRR